MKEDVEIKLNEFGEVFAMKGKCIGRDGLKQQMEMLKDMFGGK